MYMETTTQAVSRLSEEGYTVQCRAEEGGVRFLDDGAIYTPEEVVVEEVIRLEGDSVPNEESVVFAVCSPEGELRGTLCMNYGPGMDPTESDVISRLTVRPLH